MRPLRACLTWLMLTWPAAAAWPQPALIPLPASVAWQPGNVPLTGDARIEARGDAVPISAYLSQALALGRGAPGGTLIRLSIVPRRAIPDPEGYHLRAAGKAVLIEASDPRGLFHGVQTLRQLIVTQPDGARAVTAAEISDSPRFRWRGLLIDVSRHFFGKAVLLRIIDEMARYKLNRLHLHLTDDPGWRFEVPGYPKLTATALAPDGSRQYFTADELSEIVAYAAARQIDVVPEIEMPTHAGSAAAAYPELYNGGSALDPARPETYAFIRAVLTHVARLFPAPYIHFGGDEVAEDAWKGVADVDQLKARLGLKTTKAVEAYFARRVVDIVRSVGKRPMAWDEQAEAGAPDDVVIEWWRNGRPDVLAAAAQRGSELVLSPVDRLYFDYHQGPGEPGAPWEGNAGGPTSIEKILAWEPVPEGFTPDQAARVLGIEASVWTEFIRTQRYLEFMTFPRLLALAEVAWRPKGPRDAGEFRRRLDPHVEALRARGINARRGEGDGYEYITH